MARSGKFLGPESEWGKVSSKFRRPDEEVSTEAPGGDFWPRPQIKGL